MPSGTWRLSSRFREFDSKKTVLFALSLMTLAQTGCGLSPFGNDDDSKSTQGNTPKTTQNNGVGSLDPRDLASPPQPSEGITVDPPAPLVGTAGTTGPPDAMAEAGRFEPRPGGMLGSLGVNLETYFAEDIQDPGERVKRLERALTAIHGDIKTVAPSIQRLVAVEGDIQELVTQLEVLLENEAAAPAATPAPAPYSPYGAAASREPEPLTPAAPAVAPAAQPPPAAPAASDAPYKPPAYLNAGSSAPAPAATSGGASVTSLRVGEHADKVRLVIDVSADTPYKVDIDNNEKILIIELPDAGWSTAREATYGKTPILQSYRVDSGKDGKGSMLIMPLKQASTIVYQSKLNALSGTGKRIVVDLAR
jgi:hypothetical protein